MDQMLEIAGLLLGLLYLYFEFKANRWMWLASLMMTCISLYVYWNHGLYADFGINVYYLLAAVYGFACWSLGLSLTREKRKAADPLPISRTPLAKWPRLVAAFTVIYALIVCILLYWTDSTVPYLDALNTSLSIIATWMQTRKWVEQWLVWLVVDAVSVGLYIKKGIEPYAVLYAVYTVLAYVGYVHWLRKMRRQDKA
ncbi:MAG: nicotinamide riboside transporter PnuC [Prevotellaceae bacterium]|nr:nicotinamide riboside transporter PnuC [Prevotellaceae bacterium]